MTGKHHLGNPPIIIYIRGYKPLAMQDGVQISLSMEEEGAGSFEQSFYDEEASGMCSKETHSLKGSSCNESVHEVDGMERFCDYEKFEVMTVRDVEGPIEATIYEEIFQASSVDDHKLDEVSRYLRPLQVSFGVKERFREKLNQQNIHESDVADFNLGLMSVLNALDTSNYV